MSGRSRMRLHSTDANQSEIVRALYDARCSVFDLSDVGRGVSDILVGRGGCNYLLEIKTEQGKPTEAQLRFREMWRGQYAVVRTVDEALEAVGVKEVG